jgi:N-acyl-D-amino-acid deacylase
MQGSESDREDLAYTEPYTGFCLEAMDSHGAWVASAVDLVRFAAALDDPAREKWFPPEAKRLMYERPAPPADRNADHDLIEPYYACGWQVRHAGRHGKPDYFHDGSLPGTATYLVRHADGLTWAVLFNQRSSNDRAIMGATEEAAYSVTDWPRHDLFNKYK